MIYLSMDYRTLVSCTRVNSTWYREAIRRLWTWSRFMGHPDSKILPRLDRKLQQKFSRYVTTLETSDELLECPNLRALAQITFPSLQSLRIDLGWLNDWPSDDEGEIAFAPISLLNFVQPNLRCVEIATHEFAASFSGILEAWLAELAEQSRRLISFCVSVIDWFSAESPVPSSAFVSFLQNMHVLEGLEWGLLDLSKSMLMAMACKKSLQRLEILIPDSCIDGLESIPAGQLFKSLTHLTCYISAYGAEKLFPHLRALKCLSISPSPYREITRIIRVLGSCGSSVLEDLKILTGPEDTIQGPDLLLLANAFPKLQALALALPSSFLVLFQGLNDEVIEELAKALPEL